jgi:two-component system nitrate/nitrite response regulator NarL
MSSVAPEPSGILIVDDGRLFAESVASILAIFGMDVVGIGHDLESMVDIMDSARVDVVLLGIAGADERQNAVDVVKRRRPEARLVALVERDPVTPAEMTELAHFDYHIRKDASLPVFVDAVRAATKRPAMTDLPEAGRTDETEFEGEERVLAGDALTPREWDVLVLMVEGISNKGIAERLGVGPSTVNTHVQSILAKLRAHSRLEAAAFALRHGLVAINDAGSFERASGSP